MSSTTTCDQCGKEVTDSVLHLTGATSFRTLQGLVRWEVYFCSVECFWKWAGENGPQEKKAPSPESPL